MTLVFKEITIEDIQRLAKLDNPKKELERFSPEQLQKIHQKIDDVVIKSSDKKRVYELMRIKSWSMLMEESLRSSMGAGW